MQECFYKLCYKASRDNSGPCALPPHASLSHHDSSWIDRGTQSSRTLFGRHHLSPLHRFYYLYPLKNNKYQNWHLNFQSWKQVPNNTPSQPTPPQPIKRKQLDKWNQSWPFWHRPPETQVPDKCQGQEAAWRDWIKGQAHMPGGYLGDIKMQKYGMEHVILHDAKFHRKLWIM